MTSGDDPTSMRQRYSRAVRLTGPKAAAEIPGVAVEGYWIDATHFYFTGERFEPSLGRKVAIPMVADAESDRVEEVISLETLAAILSEQSSSPVDLATLSTATAFDMPRHDTLTVSLGNQHYLVDARQRRVIETHTSLPAAALYSPDGRSACFLKGYDVWLGERDTGAKRPLTTDGAARYCYGQNSETNGAAVSNRNRPTPVGLWSADSQWFLTHRIDERTLPEMTLMQHAPPGGGRPVVHCYKYPMPGDPLPMATYIAIHVRTGRVVVFNDFTLPILFFSPFFVRTVWFHGSDAIYCLRMDRYRKSVELIRLDLNNGTGRIILTERATTGYLDLHPNIVGTPNVRTLTGSAEVVWFSERDGWGHLYLYDATTGALKNQITRGPWLVRDIVHIDEAARRIVFLAGGIDPGVDPARRSLCAVDLDSGNFEVLVTHDGDIFVPPTEPCGLDQSRPFQPTRARPGISPDGRFGVVRYASVSRGNTSKILNFHTQQTLHLATARPPSNATPPRHFSAMAADGVTRLNGVMFLPSDFDENQRYPMIDDIYPGPQVAQQPQSFASMNSASARALAELGFVTIMLDTRCMPVRDRAFHQVGYGKLLELQLADHATVVRQLCEKYSFIDADRIGMIGWSGGGAATARALFDYGEVFKVGVSVCGNHDSDLYLASWSDKYRGPRDDRGWVEKANAARAHQLRGHLLLMSGDMDENVHISQTLTLVDALVRANRDFDLLVVPNADHRVLVTNGYALRRAWDYFVRHLLKETPPADFAIQFEPHELAWYSKSVMREIRQ
jgi:dipeptidyl-peptidase-4